MYTYDISPSIFENMKNNQVISQMKKELQRSTFSDASSRQLCSILTTMGYGMKHRLHTVGETDSIEIEFSPEEVADVIY